jgi:hypothetical protein
MNACTAHYFQEAFGELDPLKPELKPIHRQKPRNDMLGSYLMPETMDFYIKAVIDLWTEQANETPNGVCIGAEVFPWKLAKPYMEAYKQKIDMSTNSPFISFLLQWSTYSLLISPFTSALILGRLIKATKFHGLRITEGYNKQGFRHMMKSFWMHIEIPTRIRQSVTQP